MSVPILLYHQIGQLPRRKMSGRSLIVDPKSFYAQMKWLKKLGYKGISMREGMPYIRGEKTGKVVIITFDDGFVNVLENAAPAMAEFGFTSTNYFVANQTGGSNEWDQKSGAPFVPCMTKEQIREWADLGHEVGAHTLDHAHLSQCSEEEARRQIIDSKKILEDITGMPVPSFAYPYGDNNASHRKIVEEAGFESATTTVRRRATAQDDPFGIPRIYVRRNDILPLFLFKTLLQRRK